MKPKLLLLLIAFSGHLAVAQTGIIKGKVLTSDATPAEYINILVQNTSKGAITNSRGEFFIEGVKIGSYTLTISFVGLETRQVQVEVRENDITILPDIILSEDKQRLNEVVISGIKTYKVNEPSSSLKLQTPLFETPQNIQVISGKLIGDQQSIDMSETISRNVSGAQMIEHWGNFARINMRGFKIPAFRNGMNVDLPWGTSDRRYVHGRKNRVCKRASRIYVVFRRAGWTL